MRTRAAQVLLQRDLATLIPLRFGLPFVYQCHHYFRSPHLHPHPDPDRSRGSISCSNSSSPGVSTPKAAVKEPLPPPVLSSSNSTSPSTSSSSSSASSSSRRVLSSQNKYDLIVIGSGPAGQKCAINAAKNKKRVAIIDKKEMYGGVCIHTGTIPSKTFREAILHLTGYRQRGFYGKGFIRRDLVSSIDILARVQKVEAWETQTILDQLHRNRVVCIQGTAKFIDPHHLEVTNDKPATNPSSPFNSAILNPPLPVSASSTVNGERVPPAASASASASASLIGSDDLAGLVPASVANQTQIVAADHIYICCGTRPARAAHIPFDSPLVFDADQILIRETWDTVRHLIIIGGGVIAMEYASMFQALPGCRVTIIDEKPSILDFVDSEVVQTLRHIMGRQGATFRLGEKVVKVEATDTMVKLILDSGKIVQGDALFYAVGRQANSDTLNLEAAGVTTGKRGIIPVNEYFQTNQSHIYAGGDVIGFPALASTSMEQGRLASAHMWGHGCKMKPVFPYGIYTIPEISVIGSSEQELTSKKIAYEVGIAKFEETAKGQMIGGQHIDGFLKLLFCPHSHKLLGVAAIGESAVEIIHIGQSVMSLGGTIEYFRDSVFNYPTMAETYRVAAIDGLGRIGIAT